MEVAPVEAAPLTEADELTSRAREMVEAAGGWSMTIAFPWAHAAPAGATLPEQGWKLHVSATEDSAADVLGAVVPLLLAEGTPFKFAAGRYHVRALNSSSADRASAGKFLTIYPADDDQARRLAESAHAATAGLAGPVILSDRPYRPGSLVHYRYGGFTDRHTIDADGMVVHQLRTPAGDLVPDQRQATYSAPAWATDPFQSPVEPEPGTPRAAPAAGGSVVLEDRYVVTAAIRHANKGGTYLATDRHSGDRVVVKEGRPHVATTGAGDARHAVRHEARMLEMAGHLGLSPRLVDVFDQGGHTFLVEEFIDADGLRDLVEAAVEPPGDGLPAATVRSLAAALAGTMAAFHGAGIVLRDFTPNNILVTEEGRLILVDLELAHPACEAPTVPAGTPGYAAPEQLDGSMYGDSPSPGNDRPGFAADSWSLGATIAYLATGADPFLPAHVSHTWTDPARLAAWLVDHTDGGRLDLDIAAVVAGTMDPDPAARLSPAGVAGILAGQPAPAGRAKIGDTDGRERIDLATAISGVVRWLYKRQGSGTSGHLWPAGPSALALDPLNVQSGASGVGLFLARAAAVLDDDPHVRPALAATAAWVSERVAQPPRPPGLYFGLSGVTWFLTEAAAVLGRDDLGRRANELALSLPVRVAVPDLSHGTAGIGLAQLHQWLRTGDDRFLARAVLSAEHLMHTAVETGAGPLWPVPDSAPTRLAGTSSYGFAHGTAGIAAFLLAAAAATSESAFAATATRALDGLLTLAETGAGGSAWWPVGPDDSDLWPHWCNGSSGVGTALVRAYAVTGEHRYLDGAIAAARAGLSERWRSSTVQCHGLAGDAELLLDLAAITGDGRFREAARTAAASLWARRLIDGDDITFADDTGGHLSAGFGTGTAGVGSFLLRLAAGGPRPLCLDELLPVRR